MLEVQDGYASLVEAFYGLHRALRMNDNMSALEDSLTAYVTTLENLLVEVELRKGLLVCRVLYVFHTDYLSTQLIYRSVASHGDCDYVGSWAPTSEFKNFRIREYPRPENLLAGLVARAKQIVLEFIDASFDEAAQADFQCGSNVSFVKPPSAED